MNEMQQPARRVRQAVRARRAGALIARVTARLISP